MYAYVSPRLRHAKMSLESSERGYVKLKTPGGSYKYLLPLSGLSEKGDKRAGAGGCARCGLG